MHMCPLHFPGRFLSATGPVNKRRLWKRTEDQQMDTLGNVLTSTLYALLRFFSINLSHFLPFSQLVVQKEPNQWTLSSPSRATARSARPRSRPSRRRLVGAASSSGCPSRSLWQPSLGPSWELSSKTTALNPTSRPRGKPRSPWSRCAM